MTEFEIHDFLKRIYDCKPHLKYILLIATQKKLGAYFVLKKKINPFLPLIGQSLISNKWLYMNTYNIFVIQNYEKIVLKDHTIRNLGEFIQH